MKIKPMLAKTADLDTIDDIIEDDISQYIVQPKLDGVRAIWNPEAKALFTRNGRKVTSIPHVVQEILNSNMAHCFLDGEIFTDTFSFQQINGLVRKKKPCEESGNLHFHLFDLIPVYEIEDDIPADERYEFLQEFTPAEFVHLVPSFYVKSVSELNDLHKNFIETGYEGTILRLKDASYGFGKRNGSLLKIKPVYDLEAELIDFLPSSTKSKNVDTFGSLLLKLPNGKTFKCSSGIDDHERENLWQKKPIGADITVSYGCLSATGTPVFPRFKSIRWDIK